MMLKLTQIHIIVEIAVEIHNLGCFTNDRIYNLRVLPKRPWESFKNPEETMKRVAFKHNRIDIRY